MSSKEDKEKEKKLKAEVVALNDKVLKRRARAEELKQDIENTQRDIASRDEQILLKTEQLMTSMQKIKALDDEKSRLAQQLERGQTAQGAQRPQDKLQALMAAVNRQGEGDGDGQMSEQDAIMRDIAKIARLTYQLTARVNVSDALVGGGSGGSGRGRGLNDGASGAHGELDQVRVWYNKTSCIFKITDHHTFNKLLDEVIMYWSLEPAKNVLVNAQNFIWPLNASVCEVIGGLPGGSDGPESIIKVWNRDLRERVTFDSWVLQEEKEEKRRKEEDMQREIEHLVVHGTGSGGDGMFGGEGAGSTSGFGGAGGKADIMGQWDQGLGSQHVPGMDVAKPADQQARVPLKRGMHDGGGSHGGYGHPKINLSSNGVDLCKYIELFLFLLFITLFGNTLFMRRSVYRASVIHRGFREAVFDDVAVPKAPSRPYTIHRGLSMGTQATAPRGMNGFADTEMLSFSKIQSGSQIWQWIEGPFRAAVTGLMNGTAVVGLSEAQIAGSDGSSAVLGNNTFLRHNVLMGSPHMTQWRVQETSKDMDCIKPGRFDLYQRQCLSYYQVGVNQVKGIQVADTVMRTNLAKPSTTNTGPTALDISEFRKIDEGAYTVTAVHASSYPDSVTYDLKGISETNDGEIVKGVKREEISTSSFNSLNDLTYEQRSELFNATSGFMFDYSSQADYEARRSTILGYFTGSAFISGNLVGGGFTADPPVHSVEAFDTHTSYLKRYAWIDEKTRAVEVAFNMYNANLDVIIVSHALFELTPGGLVHPHFTIRVARLCDNWRAQDKTREQIEVVCVILASLAYLSVILNAFNAFLSHDPEEEKTAASMATEKRRTRANGNSLAESISNNFGEVPIRCGHCCKELGLFWNFIELLLITALAVDFWMRRHYQAEVLSSSSVDLFGTKYQDLTTAVSQYNSSINLSSLVMFLTILKCFKYFQLNPSVSLSWRVLKKSALSFVSYSFIFLVFMSGFTVTGYALFGPKSSEFLSMQRTGVQLFRMIVGGFEYEKMADSNPYLAPVYFMAVAIVGYFILRNLFVAIINDEFSRAATDVRENGFHWLVEDKTNDRAVSRVMRGGSSRGKSGSKMSRMFPGNRIG